MLPWKASVIVLACVSSLVLELPIPAVAASATSFTPPHAISVPDEHVETAAPANEMNFSLDQIRSTITRVNPYVIIEPNGQATIPHLGSFGLSAAQKRWVLSSIRTYNEKIKRGLIRSQNGAIQVQNQSGSADPIYWWGYGWPLTEHQTNELEAALATGSGVAWIAAELGALPSGLVAAILATGAGGIWLIDDIGGNQGIIVGVTWYGEPIIEPN